MAGTTDLGASPNDEVVEADLSNLAASGEHDAAERPWWRRFGSAFLRAMRPDGTAVWRHPPRGA